MLIVSKVNPQLQLFDVYHLGLATNRNSYTTSFSIVQYEGGTTLFTITLSWKYKVVMEASKIKTKSTTPVTQ